MSIVSPATDELFAPLMAGHPRTRRSVILALGATVVLSGTPIAPLAAAASDPRGFVDELGAQVLAIIQAPGTSPAQRQQKFRDLFTRNFDVPSIARFVVGRYWNRASSDEQSQYLDTFGDYVAAIYAEQFSHYQGEGFKTTGVRSLDEGESVVRSEIDRQGNPPIALEFRVKGTAGAFKIVDVTVEGVSLIVTKRDEFSSVLAQAGLKGVIGRMQATLKQTNAGT